MKRITLALLAVVASLMLWAFTQPKEKPTIKEDLTKVWFYYDGIGDKHEATSYGQPSSSLNCGGSAVLCAILATPSGGDPLIPSQEDVDIAAMESNDFEDEVDGLVEFKSAN